MSVTHKLAEFIADAEDGALPDWTIHEAKRTLLNLLAISLSASRSDDAKILIDWARLEGCRERASVVGSDLRTSQSTAALVNGYLCHLQDYDDTHFPTVLHPTAPVWPAVLAAAEEAGASGLATLAAFVLGAEAACRIAISVHPWHYDAGWHITGTAGVFGAAAGAGRVLGLDPQTLVAALGAAGTRASGVREVFGSLVGADTLPVRKPDPEPLFEAARRAGGHPQQCILIGDSDTDRITARAAGVPSVLVTFGPAGGDMAALEPEALLHDYADLPEMAARLLA